MFMFSMGVLALISLLLLTGIAFNQLAVLVDNKNHHLDSIYYYQRRYAML